MVGAKTTKPGHLKVQPLRPAVKYGSLIESDEELMMLLEEDVRQGQKEPVGQYTNSFLVHKTSVEVMLDDNFTLIKILVL